MKNLSKNLKELRTKQKLTHQSLAVAAGLHAATVSRIEAGDSNVSLATLTALKTALGCTLKDLGVE